MLGSFRHHITVSVHQASNSVALLPDAETSSHTCPKKVQFDGAVLDPGSGASLDALLESHFRGVFPLHTMSPDGVAGSSPDPARHQAPNYGRPQKSGAPNTRGLQGRWLTRTPATRTHGGRIMVTSSQDAVGSRFAAIAAVSPRPGPFREWEGRDPSLTQASRCTL